jgi:hypothetical protein
MASPERNISVVPAGDVRQPSAVAERLASLEDEATQLRAEVAALQDEIRWLTGEDDEAPGWLARGWVRASLLLTTVGLVAIVSLPYLLRLDASGPHTDPVAAAPRAAGAPAPVKAPAAREPVAAPARAPEVPEPARILSADDRPAPQPRPTRERRPVEPPAVVVAPARGESP